MLAYLRHRFLADERGTVLVETLLAIPVLTILTFGILEFGNMLWQRQQLQIGVRDAARYWSRCRPTFNGCDVNIARNLAFYGTPTAGTVERVPGWNASATLTITPATPPTSPTMTDIVTVYGEVTYQGSPIFALFLDDPPDLGYAYRMRYLGW